MTGETGSGFQQEQFVKETNQKFEILEKKITGQKIEIKSELGSEYAKIMEFSSNTFHAQVGSFWNVFTIMLGIITIFFGLIGYFTKVYIDKILQDAEKAKQEANDIAIRISSQFSELLDLNSKIEKVKLEIDNQDDRIYGVVRQKLVDNLLKRLADVPEDINNLFTSLASTETEYISPHHFYLLLDAYNKSEGSKAMKISLLLYQFFPTESLSKSINRNWKYVIGCAFDIEIEENTKKMINKLKSDGSVRPKIESYLQAIYEYGNKLIKNKVIKMVDQLPIEYEDLKYKPTIKEPTTS